MTDGKGPTWAIAGMGAVGAAGLLAALAVASSIPADGDAQREAIVTALTTAGATLVSVAVALGSAIWTLRLEARREARERWLRHQADLMTEADEWIKGLVDFFARQVELQSHGRQADDDDQYELALWRGNKHASTADFRPGHASLLADLIEDEDVRQAILMALAKAFEWKTKVGLDDGADPNIARADAKAYRTALWEIHVLIRARHIDAIRELHGTSE